MHEKDKSKYSEDKAISGFSTETGEKDENIITALDAFGLNLSRLRREALDGRHQLGIEDEWAEDEEAYVGVDAANRHEYRTFWHQQKPSTSGRWSTDDSETKKNRSTNSTVFVPITRAYVDAASARMADMLLPNDDRCWGLKPTPIPELEEELDSAKEYMRTTEASPILDDRGETVPSQDMFAAQETIDEFSEVLREAKKRAEKAETRIYDWFEERRWRKHCRAVIEDAAKLGAGILRGPSPYKKRISKYDREQGKMLVDESIIPESRRVDPWNFFPDPMCGEDVNDGNYIFERDDLTAKRLLELKEMPGYLPEQIDKCLKEGPVQPEVEWTPYQDLQRATVMNDEPYEIWYFEGVVKLEELISAGCDCGDLGDAQTTDQVSALVTMVNHRVVKADFTLLDIEGFSYDVFLWQRRPGMWSGQGVSRQIRTAQRMLNAATRNMMDNAALSAGPQIVVNTKLIEPVDGKYNLSARKVWKAKNSADSDFDVEKAFEIYQIDTRQAELQSIIQYALQMAEESTGLPMILQGQMGQKAPDTVGGMNMLQNNASTVLRRLAKNFDEMITIPHVSRYYQYLMEYGEHEEEKGDYAIIARGSSALVERDLQNQEIALMVNLAANPIFGLDPEKSAEEYLRSRHFDPVRFKLSEEEEREKALKAAENPPPPDPRIEVQKMKTEEKIIELEQDEIEAERAREYESIENEKDREANMEEILLKENSNNERFNVEKQIQYDENVFKKPMVINGG